MSQPLVGHAAAPPAAQETGIIQGTVRSVEGAPLAGATVQSTGTSRIAVSQRDGSFELPGVTPGQQKVRAELNGYDTGVREVYVRAGEVAHVSVTLQAGSPR